ncbi:MAG: hypothetical protein MUE40_15795 [Anaerolineae bacterium]|nr:hypothetical protein [Anaerolineae bacterium]
MARNGLAFGLLALLPALLTWLALFVSPAPATATFSTLRGLILAGFGLVVVLVLVVCAWALRTPLDILAQQMARPARWLGHRWRMLALLLLLLELNIAAAWLLVNVAPAITDPLRFLLLCWSLLLALMVATVQWPALRDGLERTRTLWLLLGIGLVLAAVTAGLSVLTNRLVRAAALDDRIRGSLDTSALVFYDDGPAPTTGQFMAEQAQRRVQWLPYSYWTVQPFAGEYINVGADGLRVTPNLAPATAPAVYFFGGSTMWGEGARDAFTIPGHLARLLHEEGTAAYLVNYGQTGYVSMQDLLLFQAQLLRGHRPQVAVFYQGFNDVLSATMQGLAGIPLQEAQRIADAETGRLLRGRMPVLALPEVGPLRQANFALVGTPATDATAILERWLAHVRMIQTLAAADGVEVIVIWQPALMFKQTLTAAEAGALAAMEAQYPGMRALYETMSLDLAERIADGRVTGVLWLADLFAADERPIFYDLVHITETGNLTVAEALLPRLREAVRD